MNLLKIKNSILTIFLIQVFSTVSYAVLYSSLALYLTSTLNFTTKHAYAIVAVFLVFNFGLHMLGSYLGGKLVSYRVLFIISMALQIIACLILIDETTNSLYIGLAFFLVATGLNVPCINMMLTQRLQNDHIEREKAFLWNYAGSNIGFFLGFTVAGYYQLDHAYNKLFIVASTFNIIAFLVAVFGWRSLEDKSTALIDALKTYGKIVLVKKLLYLSLILFVLLGIVYLSLLYPFSLKEAVLIFSVVLLLFFYWLSRQQKVEIERKMIQVYIVLAIFGLIFWSMYYLTPMALTMFAEHNVNMVLFGFQLTPQWLGNINVIIVVVGGFLLPPVFAKIREKTPLTIPTQFAFGILCLGIGLMFLPIGILFANINGEISVLWVSLFYFFQSIGELMIAPIGYSMIAKVAPLRHQGLMMGAWMLITGSTASVISSYLSATVEVNSGSTSALVTNHSYLFLFLVLAIVAVMVSGLLFLLTRKIVGVDEVNI